MKRIAKFLAILLVLCSLCLVIFSGCEYFLTNDRSDVNMMSLDVREDGIYFSVTTFYQGWKYLKYAPVSGDLSLEDTSVKSDAESVLKGKSIGRGLVTQEGYSPLAERITNLTIDGVEEPEYNALAFNQGKTVYGFCNVYTRSNFFGDTLGCDDVDRAVLFTYNDITEKMSIVEEMPGCVVVAFDGTGVIWYENKAYYGKTLGGEAVKICDDECYRERTGDNGKVDFYFGSGYCVIYFRYERNKYKNHEDYDKFVLATMTGEKLAEAKFDGKYKYQTND